MDKDIVERLVALNQTFYEQVAAPFARSRAAPQPGFAGLLPFLPAGNQVLDVGCGEGRFGRYLKTHRVELEYSGVDFTKPLLEEAQKQLEGDYWRRDISQPGFLDGLPTYDLVVCLATLQHIPTAKRREAMLAEMLRHLQPGGRLFLSSWQFMSSERQKRKLRSWDAVGIRCDQVEETDHLLSWQRGVDALRYVAFLDIDRLRTLANRLQCTILTEYRADGREGDLNLYVVWQKKE